MTKPNVDTFRPISGRTVPFSTCLLSEVFFATGEPALLNNRCLDPAPPAICSAGILEQGAKNRARNRVCRTGPPYRARICKLVKEPGNRFPACGPVQQPYLTYRGARIHRLAKSVPGLRLQIRALSPYL
jgi:hypothetical protein